MHVVVAPDSFKGTLSSHDAAAAIAAGVRDAGAATTIDECPVADGGEGTLNALLDAVGGRSTTWSVCGPLNDDVVATAAITEDGLGIVELAQAAGLTLVPPDERDPTMTTTRGVGELMAALVAAGASSILLGVGGSATIDGGIGALHALGARFFTRDDVEMTGTLIGAQLGDIARLVAPPDPPPITIACDVTNPLCGPRGAAAVFGPQKGATPEQVRALDAGLDNFARVCGLDPDFAGAGAAGGVTYGLCALAGARAARGIDLVLDFIEFDHRATTADLVITGEGQLDHQSLDGKACLGVAARSPCPCIAIVGRTGPGWEQCIGPGRLASCVSLADLVGEAEAMRDPAAVLRRAATHVMQTLI